MQLWENCRAQSFRCDVHENPADMLVAREMISVGILGACSPKSSLTSWLIKVPRESAVPPQSNLAPRRHPYYFCPVFWALWFISYSSKKAKGRKHKACVVSRLTICDIVNKQIVGLQWFIEIWRSWRAFVL